MTDRPTGEQLYQELEAEARRRGITITNMVRCLWPNDPCWKLEQMRIARKPLGATVKRIRQLIAGESVEREFFKATLPITRAERRARGIPPSRREVNEQRLLDQQAEAKAAMERRINVCRLAHNLRLPGETLHAASERRMREIRA